MLRGTCQTLTGAKPTASSFRRLAAGGGWPPLLPLASFAVAAGSPPTTASTLQTSTSKLQTKIVCLTRL